MTMQFGAFILKEFRHIFRDRRTMLILLGIPVVQIVLFGFAITTEVRNVKVAVAGGLGDETAQRIVERLDASEYFDVAGYVVSGTDADRLFRRREATIVVAFSRDFSGSLPSGEAAVQIIADASDPNQATMAANYATSIITGHMAGEDAGTPMGITPVVKMLYNPGMKSAYNFVPGVMGLILMLICAMMTSISIVREKETGTMEVLLASPVRPVYIIMAKAIPYMVLSCVNLITLVLLAVFLLGVPVAGSVWLLGLLSLLFIAVSLSLGLLISTVAPNQVIAMLLSGMVLMMPALILSGMVFPIESMPWVLRTVSNAIPARWFISAVRKVMIEGLGAAAIAREMAILGFMALFLLTVSLKNFKKRLE